MLTCKNCGHKCHCNSDDTCDNCSCIDCMHDTLTKQYEEI